jgi:hypothetical protein
MTTKSDNIPAAPRLALNVGVEYRRSYGRCAETAQLKNISLTGALLEHEQVDFGPDDRINLLFKVSGRTRKLQARIIWTENKLAGICFEPTSRRDVQIVDDFIYFIKEQKNNRKTVLDDIFSRVG